MCRFLAYSGRPLLMHDLLYGPDNSLIKQSVNAHEAEEPLNGDGFGVSWYNHELDDVPGLYTSIRPAWNDRNLFSLSSKIRAELFFAHVRAASTGEVSEANCHPFVYKNYMMMHNGGIEDFVTIKRYLRRRLSDDTYNWIRGQTDSEHLFALFLHNVSDKYPHVITVEQMTQVMKVTIDQVIEMKKDSGLETANYFNLAVSDGHQIMAVRFVNPGVELASSLYYSVGASYQIHEGMSRMAEVVPGQPKSVLIVSEKLTNVRKDWSEVPVNHFVTVDRQQNVNVVPYSKV